MKFALSDSVSWIPLVAHPERFVKGRPIATNATDQVWISTPQPTTVTSTAPLGAHRAAEVGLTTDPATSDNAELLAGVERLLWPCTQDKSSRFSGNKWFQNA